MRRDSNDEKWRKVKFLVKKRDSDVCRLVKIISISEMLILRRNASNRIKILDPAHIYPVSRRADLCYELDNIVTLNRFSHEMLDSHKHPITGKAISRGEVFKWWERIAGPRQWKAIKTLLDKKSPGESLHDERIAAEAQLAKELEEEAKALRKKEK